MPRLIRRLWSASLAGQMVGLLLLALVLSQGIGFLFYLHEYQKVVRGAAKEEFLGRTASVARLIEATPPELHVQVLGAADTAYTRYWLTPQEPGDAIAWQQAAWQHLTDTLPTGAPPGEGIAASTQKEAASSALSKTASAAMTGTAPAASDAVPWEPLSLEVWPLARPAKLLRFDDAHGFGLVVRLDNGTWLNAAFAKTISVWSSQFLPSLVISALTLSIIAMVIARRIARPMQRLTTAAERLGRGEEIAPLPEAGPDDLRRTAEAFNRMQARLRRFVEDRTRMLAAIGHDLRTPITVLRLRTEFVTDATTRERLMATLDEMQSMTEATLAFAREEAAGEATRTVDLAALLESLCDDLVELGWDVTFTEGSKTPYRCRPDALRRAICNLIENAVRYGDRARVRIEVSGEGLEITIDDDGPGIPEAEFERVFAPFVRLEGSRNRETGGVGLGLAIARTIVRSHGGDILLDNRGDGLQARIHLPRT